MSKFNIFDIVKTEDGNEWRIIDFPKKVDGIFFYKCVPNVSERIDLVSQFSEEDIDFVG